MVTTTYGEGTLVSGKAECWTLVLNMVQVIWRDMSKFRVEADTEYGSDKPLEMLRKYPW